jgi:predicted flap endonuclease-1-like 5' DNA nuclease
MIRTILGGMGVLVGLALAIAGVGLLIWLLWWLWSRRDEEPEAIEVELELPELEAAPGSAIAGDEDVVEGKVPGGPQEEELQTESAEDSTEEPVAQAAPDNLTRIEGIGPKISSVLQDAGVSTFAQLADTTPEQIEQILEEADPRLRRLAKPATWPEQAALAASGEWEALTALQKEFKRGQRS